MNWAKDVIGDTLDTNSLYFIQIEVYPFHPLLLQADSNPPLAPPLSYGGMKGGYKTLNHLLDLLPV